MKVSTHLKKYFGKRMNAIGRYLEKPDGKFTSEDFHKLRVEIKRIRAMFSLLQYMSGKFKLKKYFKPYAAIYRQAGAVRELQLQEAMLKKYSPDPLLKKYFAELRQEIRDEEQNFFSLPRKKLIKRLKKNSKRVTSFLKDVDAATVLKLLRKKRKYVDKLLTAEYLAKAQVHEMRKQIKEIYNLQRIFQPKNNQFVIADDFQELLGQWHDCMVISNDLLKTILVRKHTSAEIKHLESLEKKISAQADVLFKNIHAARFKYLQAQA